MSKSTAVATRAETAVASNKPIDTVRVALEKMRPQFEKALPAHLKADRLLRVVMSTLQTTPKLLDCDRTSLYSAIMTAAQLGLEPDGILGQGYLVPYGNRVQFIVGYKGFITLARNSGEVSSISAHEVYSKDKFEYEYGLNERCVHIPAKGDRGEIEYFYAVAWFKGGGHHLEVMTKADVDVIRARSPGQNSEAWRLHYIQMGRKTAIRRLAKFLPLNVQKAAALDDAYDSGRHAIIDAKGEIVVEAVPEDAPAQIEHKGGALDRFEQQVEKVDPETGEVTVAAVAEIPVSPLTLKGKAQGEAWEPFCASFKAALTKADKGGRLALTEKYADELQRISEIRTTDHDDIQAILAAP